MRALIQMAERCESAAPDDEWELIREAGRMVLAGNDFSRIRLNQLCDAGGFLDAARLLRPDGYEWLARSDGPYGFANVSLIGAPPVAVLVSIDEEAGTATTISKSTPGHFHPVHAATPGLALCASACRAHASRLGRVATPE